MVPKPGCKEIRWNEEPDIKEPIFPCEQKTEKCVLYVLRSRCASHASGFIMRRLYKYPLRHLVARKSILMYAILNGP